MRTEAQIQAACIHTLRSLGWATKVLHGDGLNSGWPDFWCAKLGLGQRWVEVKLPPGVTDSGIMSGRSRLTPAQREWFATMMGTGVGVWIVTSEVGIEKLLMSPHNGWKGYLGH